MNEHSLPRWQACALCLICAATHLLAAPTPARVLLITGIDYPGHKWRETTPVLVEALQQDDRLKIDVLEDPYQLETADLSPYRALFLHFMNWEKPDPGDRAKENLRQFVQNGGGMVMIHFACGAFGDWPEFQNLAGRIYDRVNTHDPRGPFTVNITATKHAITDGIDSFAVDDELYICLTGDKPVHVLATARSKITQRDHPMAFVHEYGKGRVFQTPLGHDVKALQSGRTLELVRRGTLWAAGLDADPPKNKQRSAIEQSFRVPNGFSVRLVAAEPDLANPMSIAVDEQGTLWVTEAHTYRWGPNASPFQPPANPIRRIELDSDNLCLTSTIAMAGFAEPVIGIAVANGKLYAT